MFIYLKGYVSAEEIRQALIERGLSAIKDVTFKPIEDLEQHFVVESLVADRLTVHENYGVGNGNQYYQMRGDIHVKMTEDSPWIRISYAYANVTYAWPSQPENEEMYRTNTTWLNVYDSPITSMRAVSILLDKYGGWLAGEDGEYQYVPSKGEKPYMVAELKGKVLPVDIEKVIRDELDIPVGGDTVVVPQPIISLSGYFNRDGVTGNDLAIFGGHRATDPYWYYQDTGFIKLPPATLGGVKRKDEMLSYAHANIKYVANASPADADRLTTETTRLSVVACERSKEILMVLLKHYGGWFCENNLKGQYVEVRAD